MPRTLDLASYKWLIGQLKGAREASGITQDALAKSLGRPQSFIAKTENLDRRLDVIEFIDLCLALEVDVGKLTQMAAKRTKRLK